MDNFLYGNQNNNDIYVADPSISQEDLLEFDLLFRNNDIETLYENIKKQGIPSLSEKGHVQANDRIVETIIRNRPSSNHIIDVFVPKYRKILNDSYIEAQESYYHDEDSKKLFFKRIDNLTIEYLKNNLLSKNIITAAVLERINNVMFSCNIETEKYIIFFPFNHQILDKVSDDYVYHILSRSNSLESRFDDITPVCNNKFAHYKKTRSLKEARIKVNASNDSIKKIIGEGKSICSKCLEISNSINKMDSESFYKEYPEIRLRAETTENLYLRVITNKINTRLANDYLSYAALSADKNIALYGKAHEELLEGTSEDFLLYSTSWSVLNNYISINLLSMITNIENDIKKKSDINEINKLNNYIKNIQVLTKKLRRTDYRDYGGDLNFPVVTLSSQLA